ncbi:hypothetical protein FBD94_03655 [Pedobacter hiemivivus]|uniref:DUF3999 family protein n=1 Tax=Pedobacter hiemivivus TaxID=2530454 RepID=A0A4V5PDQ9_9SPHI|nr:hypothetical protein [Pedobacter hiemivivus]TKC65646.1 hypothetical protein FBD94_03655 [Pedobacter hiemivivus]
MKFKFFVCALFLLNWTVTSAQSFKWNGNLDRVSVNGFYKIALTPEIISKTANKDLSDIRIFEKQKEIAYLLRQLPDNIYLLDTSALKLEHYTNIPAPSVTTTEDKENKRTIVSITFKVPYQIDKLKLNLEGFQYYRRTTWISEKNPLVNQKRRHYSEDKLTNIIISSEKQPTIDLYGENRYKQLFLIIENEDSSPLLIKNIEAYQKNMELIAYLEKDKQYVIKTGQLNMEAPKYDLSYFKDSISNTIPSVAVLNFEKNTNEALDKESGLVKKSWMWGAIVLLIVFLGYLSYYMVREMQSKKQGN